MEVHEEHEDHEEHEEEEEDKLMRSSGYDNNRIKMGQSDTKRWRGEGSGSCSGLV